MVMLSVLFLSCAMGARAAPCTSGDYVWGDVCNDTEEGGSFLQTAGMVARGNRNLEDDLAKKQSEIEKDVQELKAAYRAHKQELADLAIAHKKHEHDMADMKKMHKTLEKRLAEHVDQDSSGKKHPADAEHAKSKTDQEDAEKKAGKHSEKGSLKHEASQAAKLDMAMATEREKAKMKKEQKEIEEELKTYENGDAAKMKAELSAAVKILKIKVAQSKEEVEKAAEKVELSKAPVKPASDPTQAAKQSTIDQQMAEWQADHEESNEEASQADVAAEEAADEDEEEDSQGDIEDAEAAMDDDMEALEPEEEADETYEASEEEDAEEEDDDMDEIEETVEELTGVQKHLRVLDPADEAELFENVEEDQINNAEEEQEEAKMIEEFGTSPSFESQASQLVTREQMEEELNDPADHMASQLAFRKHMAEELKGSATNVTATNASKAACIGNAMNGSQSVGACIGLCAVQGKNLDTPKWCWIGTTDWCWCAESQDQAAQKVPVAKVTSLAKKADAANSAKEADAAKKEAKDAKAAVPAKAAEKEKGKVKEQGKKPLSKYESMWGRAERAARADVERKKQEKEKQLAKKKQEREKQQQEQTRKMRVKHGEAFFKEHNSKLTGVLAHDCVKHAQPLQVLAVKGQKGFFLKELNVETGQYTTVYPIPFSHGKPRPYSDINSCGVNPEDGILYCAVKQGENYVVRVDKTKFEYVAKLPGFGYYNTAAFSPDGDYYIADSKARFLVITNLAKLKGYPAKTSKGIADYMKEKLKKPKGFHSAADAVVTKADLDGTGEKNYMIVVNRGSIQIARFEGSSFTKTWVIPYMRGKQKASWKDIWGAGWSFNGKVFFAHNKGKGVYGVPMAEIDLSKSKKEIGTIKMPRIGKSSVSLKNDGANCMNSPDPWVTKTLPWDCKSHGAPIQVLREETGYSVKKLELKSGQYTDIYSIAFTKTTPAFKYLNAIGISSVDGIPYGCLLFAEFPAPVYIVRFDEDKIEYVAKIPQALDPIGGTFDSDGTYFFTHNTANSTNPVMYSIAGLDTMKGYASHTEAKLPVLTLRGKELTGYRQIADIVSVNFEGLEGKGVSGEYILGVNRDQQVAMVKWNKDVPEQSTVWKFGTNDVATKHAAYRNFGAAWNYNGRVFFASNDGIGVYETKSINVAQKWLTLAQVGKSKDIVNNDGFNCWNQDSPFPVSNPAITVVSAFKN